VVTPVADASSALAASGPLDRRAYDALVTLGRPPTGDDPRTRDQAAVSLVSTLFFQPLLEEMRKLPFGGEIGHGGRGEDVFGGQLDRHMADAVAASGAGGMARAVRSYIEAKIDPAKRALLANPGAESASWKLRRDLAATKVGE
jgi:hypothetical protein